MFPREARHSDDGFTLIELLVAMMVSGLILSAIVTAFITAARGTVGAHDRFVASNAAQTLATYFTTDVQSANPSLVSNAAAESTGCSSTPPSTKNVLRLQWSENTTATTMSAYSVSYRTRQVGSAWQLVRYACSGQLPLPTTPSAILSAAGPADHVVVQDLYDPSPPSPYPTTAGVTGSKITLNAFAALGQGAATPYSYRISATMRTPTLFPVVISMNRLDSDPTTAAIVRWTVTFSEPVTGVDITGPGSDFVLAPSGVPGASIIGITGTGSIYTVTATTGPGIGTFGLGLNLADNDSIIDSESNQLGSSGPGNGDFTGQVYTIDRTAPAVNVNQKTLPPAQMDPATTLPIVFTVTFSEPVFGFVAAGVTRTGTAPGGSVSVTGSGANYEIAVTGLTGNGTVTALILAGRATDAAGNPNTASASTDNTVQYNAPAPPPMVSSIVRAGTNPTGAASLSWTVTFDKPVTGVDASDFQLAPSGGVTGPSIVPNPVSTDGGTTWTVIANRGSGYGTLGLNLVDNDSIQSGSAFLVGPTGPDGSKTGAIYTISAISSLQLLNATSGGHTAGQIERDDQIVITFSTPMDISSVCSGWDGTGNKKVLVTVNDSATDDSISVTSTADCPTLQVGTIALGSGAYVNGGNVTFDATGNNASQMSWDLINRKLTITLGNKSNGVGAGPGNIGSAVASSTATYTPDANIKDSTGVAIGNLPISITGRLF